MWSYELEVNQGNNTLARYSVSGIDLPPGEYASRLPGNIRIVSSRDMNPSVPASIVVAPVVMTSGGLRVASTYTATLEQPTKKSIAGEWLGVIASALTNGGRPVSQVKNDSPSVGRYLDDGVVATQTALRRNSELLTGAAIVAVAVIVVYGVAKWA